MIAESEGGIRIAVKVTVRARRSEIVGPVADAGGRTALAVRLAAPPVDGAANAALIALVAAELGVPKSAVAIGSGEKSRRKTVHVTGITAGAATARLERRAG